MRISEFIPFSWWMTMILNLIAWDHKPAYRDIKIGHISLYAMRTPHLATIQSILEIPLFLGGTAICLFIQITFENFFVWLYRYLTSSYYNKCHPCPQIFYADDFSIYTKTADQEEFLSASSNSSRAITFTFGQILFGKVWTLFPPSYGLNSTSLLLEE